LEEEKSTSCPGIFEPSVPFLEDAMRQRQLKRQQVYDKPGSSWLPGSSLTHAARKSISV